MNRNFASVAQPAAQQPMAIRWPILPRRRPLTLRAIFAIWGERMRLRRELGGMLKDSRHLVDDIGLTPRQVEAEIAKPFWQA